VAVSRGPGQATNYGQVTSRGQPGNVCHGLLGRPVLNRRQSASGVERAYVNRMKSPLLRTLAIGAALVSMGYAQNNQRQAVIIGGGSPDAGKCTVEVVVDGVSQVEIRGAAATLRNLSGQPPQWRRFDCTGAMPANPPNFRFAGVDVRGKQELVRDPGNGGVAIVQIEDKDGGAEGYTFDIMWNSRGGGNGQYDPNSRPAAANPPLYRDNNQSPARAENDRERGGSGEPYRPNYRDSSYFHRYGHGFAVEEAVRVCKEAIVRQSAQRFRTNDMHFLKTVIDDNPGREDWVTGSVDVHFGRRQEQYGFSCSVNFDNGQVRSAELDARPIAYDPRPR